LAAARKHGMVVAHYVSDYAAVLRPKTGANRKNLGVMAMSTLPLRARDDAGHERAVSLTLQQQGTS
jgi:hypothetical protein